MKRRGLFVGGPWHGTIRHVTVGGPIVFALPVKVNDRQYMYAENHEYTREQFATIEADGYATVDVWLYKGISSVADQATASRLTAEAALRCLLRGDAIDHKFAALQLSPGVTLPPEVLDRERCTPRRDQHEA